MRFYGVKANSFVIAFLIFTTLIVATISSSCAPFRDQPESTDKADTNDLTSAQTIARQTNVICPADSECHEAVAMLAIATKKSATVCTGFLIEPDLLATNGHCIPSELRFAKADCRERIWAYFPSIKHSSSQAESIGCASIVDVSKASSVPSMDYAFIRLARTTQRIPLKISTAGAPLNEFSVVYKVDPYFDAAANRFRGYLGRDNCRTIQRTVVAPYFDNPMSPNATLTDCQIIPGNSGSPLVAPNGKAWSLAQAVLATESKEAKSLSSIKLMKKTAPLSLSTNFACVDLPGEPKRALAEPCTKNYSAFESIEFSLAYLMATAATQDQSPLVAAATDEAMQHHFLLSERSVLRAFRWAPLGTIQNDLPRRERPTRSLIEGILARPACQASEIGDSLPLTFKLPLLSLKHGLNEFYQVGYQAAATEERVVVTLARNGSRLAMSALAKDGSRLRLFEEQLPACEH